MSCGAGAPKWSGRCSSCGDWNTLSEELETPDAGLEPLAASSPPTPITQLTAADGAPVPTGIAELDRVLGGGFVPGSVTLLGGEPGVGKSTLVLQALAARARAGARVLYVTGEESADQVRLRAERVDALDDNLLLAAETAMGNVAVHLEAVRPELVVVDSVQTLFDARFSSAPGSVTQVRECAHRLVQIAKATGTSVLLVGHVTKDGQIAGPRVLEHMVDAVLYFEGERGHQFRILRAVKNRFGPANEIGVFEMAEAGLMPVANPSALFLADREDGVAGSAVLAGMEGTRPLLVEIQALVAPSGLGTPRRAVVGWDGNRLAMLLAVLEARCGLVMSNRDVYLNVAGGLRVQEPAADLAVAAAIISSELGHPVPLSSVFFGEVGLAGEVRAVGHGDARLKEAGKLGFLRAVMPRTGKELPSDLRLEQLGRLEELAPLLGGAARPRRPGR